jgi:hypothetical protein
MIIAAVQKENESFWTAAGEQQRTKYTSLWKKWLSLPSKPGTRWEKYKGLPFLWKPFIFLMDRIVKRRESI